MAAVDGATNKALVEKWFAIRTQSPEGLAMITDDFAWIGPPSEAELFGTEDATLRGRDGLSQLTLLNQACYDMSKPYEVNVHFTIADGDIVVREFDASFETNEGEHYHNQYCLVIRVRGDKIAEVREHIDSQRHHTVTRGTPEKMAAVMGRLARLRAGETL
jgi:ketosteroid isomerase-like protein